MFDTFSGERHAAMEGGPFLVEEKSLVFSSKKLKKMSGTGISRSLQCLSMLQASKKVFVAEGTTP